MEDSSNKNMWIYYFLHGLSFSILYFVLGIGWAFLLALLVIAGLFIGFIIGCVVLFFIIGWLNSFLTEVFWDIPGKTDWKNLLAHGFALFFVLLIAQIPYFAINIIAPNIIVAIALFFAYCFIDGFIAKYVGEQFEFEEEYV